MYKEGDKVLFTPREFKNKKEGYFATVYKVKPSGRCRIIVGENADTGFSVVASTDELSPMNKPVSFYEGSLPPI